MIWVIGIMLASLWFVTGNIGWALAGAYLVYVIVTETERVVSKAKLEGHITTQAEEVSYRFTLQLVLSIVAGLVLHAFAWMV